MSRLRTPLLLAAVLALTAGIRAADAKAKGADGHGHANAVYTVHYHDEAGKHRSRGFNLSMPAEKAELDNLIAHGHVTELHNASAPSISTIASLTADLGIWTLVIFGGLLFLLNRMAWPKMLTGLQKRESAIMESLEAANRAKSEADAMRANFKAESDKAQGEVRALLDEARRDAAALRDEEIRKTKDEIAAERERATREIEVETDQALQKIWGKAADLATQVSSMALRKQLDETAHRRLIDDALGELKAANTN